ncbi:DinB family protein [Streptomyces sp. CA-210063]|uniref:DinB family protein n=1 Tax=Streptomyces sp. CA-210063 TaxID=2801029 RepID=UPI00214C6C2E|nr:DinB family protein [Streptomyces sp. CA-210063]UUU36377.1 DinB family protein [Streptomyces sp. CA-210063]
MLLRMSDSDEQTRPDEQPLPERKPGWGDRFVGPEGDPRGEGGYEGERATLVGYLRDQRLTLELKCAGLDAEALARRSVPPSTMSLLGLVRHLAGVEQYWFREALAGRPVPRHYRAGDDPDGDFNGAVADPEAVADAWKTWRSEVDFAERFVAAAPDLGVTGRHDDEPIALREVLVHMIEEYARHNGHADFLRERIDGRIGQ